MTVAPTPPHPEIPPRCGDVYMDDEGRCYIAFPNPKGASFTVVEV